MDYLTLSAFIVSAFLSAVFLIVAGQCIKEGNGARTKCAFVLAGANIYITGVLATLL